VATDRTVGACSAPLRTALARASPLWFAIVAGSAGFSTYFAMYAFRKPFAAAPFAQVPGWHHQLQYKVALVLAQVAGYALSKFLGVKVVSEIAPRHRAVAIITLVGVSWMALIAFALIPVPWNVLAFFVNGLPLGMIWGLVYGFMEGRRISELLAAMLCASFILSSGVVKSVGLWLMQSCHVSEFWMPALTGALFVPVLVLSVWVLSLLPPPSARDEAERVRRAPMTAGERWNFLIAYGPGLAAITLGYVLLTALRDYRDNFAAEIWTGLGFGGEAGIFSASELPVAVIALVGMALVMLVRDNGRALVVIHAMVAAGFALVGISTLAFQAHLLSPLVWMILVGSGLYLAYNPINAVLFDRLIAYSGRVGTAGFLIYVADAAGYLGSVAVLLWRTFGMESINWLQFFILGAKVTSLVGGTSTLVAAVYFHRRRQSPAGSGSEKLIAQSTAA
jgi:hypothetical protein